MTGPEHYKEAERMLAEWNGGASASVGVYVLVAQVHATLALVAATAYPAEVAYYGAENTAPGEWAQVLTHE